VVWEWKVFINPRVQRVRDLLSIYGSWSRFFQHFNVSNYPTTNDPTAILHLGIDFSICHHTTHHHIGRTLKVIWLIRPIERRGHAPYYFQLLHLEKTEPIWINPLRRPVFHFFQSANYIVMYAWSPGRKKKTKKNKGTALLWKKSFFQNLLVRLFVLDLLYFQQFVSVFDLPIIFWEKNRPSYVREYGSKVCVKQTYLYTYGGKICRGKKLNVWWSPDSGTQKLSLI